MSKELTPETYPGECTVSAEELREVKELFFDDDHAFGDYIGNEWPPTDSLGNVYPIFFTADELDKNGKLRDNNGWAYPPFCGNIEPLYTEGHPRCNTPVTNYEERYNEIRYCGQIVHHKEGGDGYHTFCYKHKGRDNVKTAQEQLQTGLFTNSLDYLYEKLNPWQKLVGWGTFEGLMDDSVHEFGVEYESREFDFSDQDYAPDDTDEDGILSVDCGYPTQYGNRALYLWVAAMQTVQMVNVQPRVMWEGTREDGTEEGMMETKSVEKAQLTAPPSEHDSSPQEFRTIETWNEHHLNLPLSRLIKDQPRLLEMGGVESDVADTEDGIGSDEIVLEIEADPEGIETRTGGGTDPNSLGDDYMGESEKILEHATEDDD